MNEWISMEAEAATGRGRLMSLREMVEFVQHTPHRYT